MIPPEGITDRVATKQKRITANETILDRTDLFIL